MFGPIGGPELILILVLALLLFGPRKMPQIGRMVGKALQEFRSVTTEFKSTLDREVALDEIKKTREDLQSVAGEVKGAVSTAVRGTLEVEPAGPAQEPKAEAEAPKAPVEEPKAPTGAEMVAEATRKNGAEAPKPDTPDGGSAEKT